MHFNYMRTVKKKEEIYSFTTENSLIVNKLNTAHPTVSKKNNIFLKCACPKHNL